MANHTTGAQRHNAKKDATFAKVNELSKTYGSPHGGDHRSEAMKKAIHAKMGDKKLKDFNPDSSHDKVEYMRKLTQTMKGKNWHE